MNNELEDRVSDRTQALSETNQNLQGTIQTLRNTQNQLIQAEKMASLGNLVAGISHEINTPWASASPPRPACRKKSARFGNASRMAA